MKNKGLLFLIAVLLFFVDICVNAKTIVKIIVPVDGVRLRSEPTSSSSILVDPIPVNTVYELVEDKTFSPSSACTMGWYKVYYDGQKTGYVCANYADELSRVEVNENATADCKTDLKSKGFPDSYIEDLCKLKAVHPAWTFTPDFNGLDFGDSVFYQEYDKKSLIQSFNEKTQGFLDTEYISYNYLTDTFIVKEGSNWYNASHDTVAYFVDPRNFFNEQEIFMFEQLDFNSNAHSEATVKNILAGRDVLEKSSVIYNAGKTNNISPIYLASRIKLETTGNYTNYSIRGTAYGNYAHIYNPYNVGANGGAVDGITWAAGNNGYGTPWTTLDKGINGGAGFIRATYFARGQDTTYFQKFNTSSYRTVNPYTWQYQTNIQGPAVEAISTYNGYTATGYLEKAFHFVIPVYTNMPAKASPMPNEGNPNNHLKSITIGGKALTGFEHDKYTYDCEVSTGTVSVNISGEVINKNAKITGAGTIKLTGDKTVVTLTVTAQNKSVQKYVISVIKSDKIDMSLDDILASMSAPISGEMLIYSAGITIDQFKAAVSKASTSASVVVNAKNATTLSTGDTVTIAKGNDKKTFNIVIKGDISGDGNIDIQDLLKVQKFILGYSDLAGPYFKAGDTNQDGLVNVTDLLRVQKHILGYITIK